MALNDTLARMWGGLLGRPVQTAPNDPLRIVQDAINQFNANFTTLGGGYTAYSSHAKTFVEKGYMSNPDLYAVVNQMVTKMVSAPLRLKQAGGSVSKYRSKFNEKKGMFYNVHDRVNLYKAMKEEDVKDVINHPIIDLLDNPNPYQSKLELLEIMFLFLKLTGNVYVWKQRRQTGDKKPFRLYVLPSHLIEIVTDKETGNVTKYKVIISPSEFGEYDADEVIHIKYANPNYGIAGEHLYGQSPLLAAKRILQGSNEAIDRMIEIMASGGVFGFLSSRSDQNPITNEQGIKLHNKLKASNRSKEDLARLFITAANLQYIQVGLKPTDLEINENTKSYMETFCRIFGWSPMLMNTDTVTRDNFKTAWSSSISQAIAPDLIRIQEALTKGICHEWDKRLFFEFDISEYSELRADLKEMADLLATSWWISPNEKRFAMYYDTDANADMDKYYAPMGLTTLEQINEPPVDLDTADYRI